MRKEVADKLLEKVRADYDRIADSFSATRTAPWPETLRFRDFVKTGDRALDIGCGNGRAYQLFEGLAIEYEGVDVSERLIALAKNGRRDLLASFRVGSILSLPFDNSSFDAAVAVAVLHHIPSREYRLRALGEVRRVLRPGGRLLMTNWDLWQKRYAGALAVSILKNFAGISGRDWNDAFVPWRAGDGTILRYYHAFTSVELRRLCADAGFVVESDRREGGNFVTVCRRSD